jgi:hypothetical protein
MPGAPDTSLYIRACITSVRISLLNGDHGGISRKVSTKRRRHNMHWMSSSPYLPVEEEEDSTTY